jgi:hypothetical protein
MLEHEAERWLSIQQNLGKAPNTLLAYRRSPRLCFREKEHRRSKRIAGVTRLLDLPDS